MRTLCMMLLLSACTTLAVAGTATAERVAGDDTDLVAVSRMLAGQLADFKNGRFAEHPLESRRVQVAEEGCTRDRDCTWGLVCSKHEPGKTGECFRPTQNTGRWGRCQDSSDCEGKLTCIFNGYCL